MQGTHERWTARIGRGLWRATLLAGWASVAAVGVVVGVDASGATERWAEERLGAALGPAVGAVRIDEVDLRWSTRSVVLRGLTLGEGRPDLVLDRLVVRVGWRAGGGLSLERIEAGHGDLRISRALVTGLEALLETREDEGPPALPEVVLRDLSIAVETPPYGDLALGALDAALVRDERGRPDLSGRLTVPHGGGEVFLTGRLAGPDLLEVRGAARALPLSSALLPQGEDFDLARRLDPRASLDLEADARWRLGRDVLPEMQARLAISDADLALPWIEDAEERRVEDVRVALEASFHPGDPLALWDRDAWRALGRAELSWEGIDLTAALRVGRAAPRGRLAEAWLHAPRLPVDDRTLELGARRRWLTELWQALSPRGEVEVVYGVAFQRGWTPADGLLDTTDRVASILFQGEASMAYVGWPNRETGKRDQGFPLRLSNLTGQVHYAHRAERQPAEEIAIVDLSGDHDGDVVRASGSLRQVPGWTRPPERRREPPEQLHLLVESEGVTVSDDLRPAFEGLRGIEGCEDLWGQYLPTAGRLGVRLELDRTAGLPELATELRIDFQELSARWIGFPVRCHDVNGRLHLTTEGRGPAGRAVTRLDVTGRSAVAGGPVRVQGRGELARARPDASRWQVEIEALDARAPRLLEVLGLRDPRALAGVESAGASGALDATFTAARPGPGGSSRSWLEAVPTAGGLRLEPAAFPRTTRGAHGHVLANWSTPEDGAPSSDLELRLGLLGRWGEEPRPAPVWIGGSFPPGRTGTVSLLAAGVDPLEDELVDALETSISRRADEPVELDLSAVEGRGRVDFEARFALDGAGGELRDGEVQVALRLDELGLRDSGVLEDLSGQVTWSRADEAWRGTLLRARLGHTPVTLRDVVLRRPEAGGWSLQGVLWAEGVPVDREHLRYFLDARTLRALVEDFDARGRFDVRGGALTLAVSPEGATALRFRGALSVDDLSLAIGLPIDVRSAEEVEVDLRLEEGHVRALARVGRLFGEVADRSLDDARLQISYIEPRLTIEALDGGFEGGRLRSLEGRGGSTFFAVDLEPPFPFVLAGRLAHVDVGQLLRGVFNSNFANRGRLDANLVLRGDLEHLTEIRGGGEFALSESALWAVPLFQAVLSRLGFESAGTFSQLEASYRIEDGVVRFPQLTLQSDLLSLVGGGEMDMDGSLRYDLEVRYSLLDRLGLLTRLLYEIQNSLLRISVRGDMSRPEVIVKGFFSQFFASPTGRKRLPVPGYSELPDRF